MANQLLITFLVVMTICSFVRSDDDPLEDTYDCSKVESEYTIVKGCIAEKYGIDSTKNTDPTFECCIKADETCIKARNKCELKDKFKKVAKYGLTFRRETCINSGVTYTMEICNGLKTNPIPPQCQPYLPCDYEQEVELAMNPPKASDSTTPSVNPPDFSVDPPVKQSNQDSVCDLKSSAVLILSILFVLIIIF